MQVCSLEVVLVGTLGGKGVGDGGVVERWVMPIRADISSNLAIIILTHRLVVVHFEYLMIPGRIIVSRFG